MKMDCPPPEVIAALAEGKLTRGEIVPLLNHIEDCAACREELRLASLTLEEEAEEAGPRRSWWLAAAAAFVFLVIVPAAWVWQVRRSRSPIETLAALAPRSARIIEPRLSGGFTWAPYHGSQRAIGSPSSDPERMKLTGAAGELIERAQHDGSAHAEHAAGVALVLTQNDDEAIARLEKAAAESPSPQTWNDLAAARYAAASDRGRYALYPQALAACDAALRLDPKNAEALFNRALILQRIGLADAARAAWMRYLEVDPSSKWADEARKRLAELPATKASSSDPYALAEVEYLGRWADAVLQKNDAEAARWLTTVRSIGVAAEKNGELLLRDVTRTIDNVPESQRGTLAAAHAAYRAGRMAYRQQKLDEALAQLGRAEALFRETHSPMVLAARYYIAGIHQAQQDPGAAAELKQVMQDVGAQRGYRALAAHVRWELGRAYFFDYDWTHAIATLSEGARMFREEGDRTNEAFVEAILAASLSAEGRGDESWKWRIESLRALSAAGNPARLAAAMQGAMRADFVAGRKDAALALARIPQPVAADAQQLSLVLDVLSLQSMIESQSGDSAGALQTAEHAASLARRIPDPSLRARRLADVDVAIGAATAAPEPLTRAIDFYRRVDLPYALPEPLLLRARCAVRRRDWNAANRDLEEGMAIVERHRGRAAAAGSGILDADRALFTDAIRLRLDRGDSAGAFAIAERARGAAITVGELQRRLARSETAVLEIALLGDETVTIAIDEDDFRVARRRGETALGYDELIRPVDAVLAHARHVIVVPDPRLATVPFAALYDRVHHCYLVERVTVATALSAGSLLPEDARAASSVVTVSLPTGDAVALPEAGEEVADIGTLYRSVTPIAPDHATFAALRDALTSADVVHVAGHTERQPAGGEYALLLNGQRVSSRTVAGASLGGRLLVLAACETLRPPDSTDTHALSLGGAFVAAGVANVIGTLTPVGDRDARAFFRDLHRRLVAGESASEALQSAQVAAIQSGSQVWRSIALVTSRIETLKGEVRS